MTGNRARGRGLVADGDALRHVVSRVVEGEGSAVQLRVRVPTRRRGPSGRSLHRDGAGPCL
jgi:hypothetical protein